MDQKQASVEALAGAPATWRLEWSTKGTVETRTRTTLVKPRVLIYIGLVPLSLWP